MGSKFSPKLVEKEGEEEESRESMGLDFRAPPPSPIGSSRRGASVTNDEVLTEFLEHTLRVPDLILPDRIFPRQKSLQDIPTVDFPSLLTSPEFGSVAMIRDSLTRLGCFQLINHGISPDLVGPIVNGVARIFQLPLHKKRMAVRSPEMPFGFEVEPQEVNSAMREDFIWGNSSSFHFKMEGISPTDYSNFSEKMEKLAVGVERISKEIMSVLHQDFVSKPYDEGVNVIANDNKWINIGNRRCHIMKHPHDVAVDECIKAVRYDIIRMMIGGSDDDSHALSIHICDGSSEFHVYSKKASLSFTPSPNALVVAAGDQIQEWSGGLYKHVIGRPIYISKNEDHVSMAFLYSPPPTIDIQSQQEKKDYKIITLRQQALFAFFLTTACQFLFLICNKL